MFVTKACVMSRPSSAFARSLSSAAPSSAMRNVPHEGSPLAWCATAWPVHADWGDARDGARLEVADLAMAMAGHVPENARFASGQAATSTPRGGPAGPAGPGGDGAQIGGAPAGGIGGGASGLVLPTAAERLALGLAPDVSSGADDSGHPIAVEGLGKLAQGAAVGTALEPAFGERATMLVLHPGGHPGGEAMAGALGEAAGVVLTPCAYGDVWLRDTSPVFVRVGDTWRAVAMRFNGWGGRFYSDADAGLAAVVAGFADMGVETLEIVGEPGALEFDGEGTLITSRRCMLNKNRNPNMAEADAEAVFGRGFGVERTLWIEERLAGDHTDGHTDTLARVVRPGLVVTEAPYGPGDPNAQTRDDVARRLDGARDAQGRALDVVRVPGARMPAHGEKGPLPATHMNYVTVNGRVIVPLYGDVDDLEDVARDQGVLDAFAAIFPDREVMGLACRAIMSEGGGFHCLTTHAPAGVTLDGLGFGGLGAGGLGSGELGRRDDGDVGA